MSNIDLSAAIEKAVDVLYDWNWDPEFPPEDEQRERDAPPSHSRESPAIRDQITRDIGFAPFILVSGHDWISADEAKRIARGES